MLMSEAGAVFHVENDYRVEIEAGDHLVLIIGANYGSPASRFNHANIAARQYDVHELKHYRRSGSKFWTARPGVNFYFVIPKDRITMIAEKGYSYVPVEINGLKLHLNVSGGGGPGWTDWVHKTVFAHVGCTVKTLKIIAAVALSPEECKSRGIVVDVKKMDEQEQKRFVELAAACDVRPTLKTGSKIMLQDNVQCDCKEMTVEDRPKGHTWKRETPRQCVTALDNRGSRWKVKFSHINWTKTAQANNIPLARAA